MRTIERTGGFKRDYKRVAKGRYGRDLDGLLLPVFECLVEDRPLPLRYRDHGLLSNWAGHRDCHLKPGLILIYKVLGEDLIQLVRLGSHSELGL